MTAGAPAQAAFPGVNGKIYLRISGEVHTVDPDGGNPTQLTSTGGTASEPRVNGDGTKVAFLGTQSGSRQVYTMDPDGTGVTQVTTGSAAFGNSLAWSPAGDRLVYVAGGYITTIDPDGTDPFSLGVSGTSMSWSPDGTKIAYIGTGNIHTINTDGTGDTAVTSVNLTQAAAEPDWSPDGTKIAFTISRIGFPSQIHTIDATGANLTNLSNNGENEFSPVWSPDGAKIIAFRQGYGLLSMNTDGTGKSIIYSNTGAVPTDWSISTTPPGADVSVSVSDSADPVALGGDPYTYTVTVANAGPTGATGLTVSTTLSGANRTINSAVSSQGSCAVSAPTVSCTLGAVAASGSATVTISATPSATGTITATSTVSATETDPNSGNNTAAQSTTVNNALGCTITGTPGNDTLNGTNGADVICGLGGDDIINGGNNNDTIYGGADDDDIDGGNGDDTIHAGTGDDTIDGGNSDDILHGGDGDDVMGGGNGADYLYGEAGNDTNYGETFLGSLLYLFDNGNDHIYGGPGNDDLDGQNGNDTIVDHDGTDTMSGSNGNDTIDVQDGVGGDTANGGLGSDTCVVDGGDTTSSC
ncbi:hypothetical protein Aglo03_08280 [Actinokineospora globicatena]|uniref:DUF11 domain-containing protein n=1 Tax=Actinokineospora globicatena TaxID=103729 RepID=A0A9W6QID0_9PSEU|nr:hypothetical protein Aglo03_08280 [Actinokineospora globicatena]